MTPGAELRDVRKSYGDVVALYGIDLTIMPGEILGVVGPNGAGKTTLMSILAGRRKPDTGTVKVAGVDVLGSPRRAQAHVGFAPQEIAIYPPVTVRDNLLFFAKLAGLRRALARRRVEEASEALLLTALLDRTAGRLSGGEQRRLHAAAAFLSKPAVLLLDEPTAGADVATREAILAAVRNAAREGTAVLYSTHYLPEVEALAASVALLEKGRCLAQGSVKALIAAHGRSRLVMTFEASVEAFANRRGRGSQWIRLLPGWRAKAAATDFDRATSIDGVVTVECADPAAAVVETLTELGPDAERLQSIDVVRPSLETVYLTLTGRQYRVDPAKDDGGVPAQG